MPRMSQKIVGFVLCCCSLLSWSACGGDNPVDGDTDTVTDVLVNAGGTLELVGRGATV